MPKNALEPYISAKTLEFHHGKHHKAYVDTLNKLVEGTLEASQSLEEIIVATYHDEPKAACSTMPPRCGTTLSSGTA